MIYLLETTPATLFSPYFFCTYRITSSRLSSGKSVSISGIVFLSGFKKRSNGVDTKTYLFELSKLGLKKRLGSQVNDLYKKRLSHELQIIDEMGFCNYFLVVYDFILYAKIF